MNKIFDIKKLGPINLEGHILHPKSDFNKTKYAFVCIGQGGGKLGIDFSRANQYISIFNTAQEDLNGAEQKLKEIGNNNYKLTKFSGFDGSKKDRNIGQKAVRENLDTIKVELLADEKLYDADFVWVTVALGGGTGSGAVTDITKIISQIIRRDDKRLGYEEDGDYIINEGKPTVGVIAMVPEKSSGHKMKLNAAEALQELQELQQEGLLGSILLIDNEKLISNHLNDEENDNVKWHVKGNASVVEMLTEVSITSSLPAEENFDKSELLDILSEPGYLAFSKKNITERSSDDMKTIVKESFTSQIFSDGYDLNDALISSLLLVRKENSKLFSTRDEILLKNEVSEALSNTRYIHYGIYDVLTTKKYTDVIKSIGHTNDNSNDSKAIIYTMSVMKNPPKNIVDMTLGAIKKKKMVEESLNQSNNNLKSIDLSSSFPTKKKKVNNMDIDSLLGSSSKRGAKSNSEVDLESLFNKRSS